MGRNPPRKSQKRSCHRHEQIHDRYEGEVLLIITCANPEIQFRQGGGDNIVVFLLVITLLHRASEGPTALPREAPGPDGSNLLLQGLPYQNL